MGKLNNESIFAPPKFSDFSKNILKVLAYHKIKNTANFENQLIYLKQNYSVISIEELHNFFTKALSFLKSHYSLLLMMEI